nr:PAS domain-containing sensor histidine kinase [uncultured Dongia sp.]
MFGKRKNVGGIWLVIAIVVFLPAALFGGIRTFDALTSLLLNYRTGTWLVVEAQEEFHMARLAAASFQLTPDAAARDHLKLRFDVFWSRIPIILDSDEGEGVRRIPKVAANAQLILDTLPTLEHELALVRLGEATSLEPFLKTLEMLETPLEEMVRILLVQDQMRQQTRDLSSGLWLTIGAFVVTVLAGVALIIGNLLKTHRMEELYTQHQAAEQERATQLAAIESSGEGIVLFDERGRLHYSNEAFHILIDDDFSRDITRMDWHAFLGRRSMRDIARHFRRSDRPWQGEVVGKTLTGKRRAWAVHVMERQEGGYIALVRDLTDRQQAEQQREALLQTLHHADKMSAIGRVAGGVAHDFNNILAAISGFASLLELDLGDNPKQRHMLRQIGTAANRGKELVHSIMTFSRAEQADRTVIDAGEICREAATIAGVAMSGRAHFEIDIDAGPLPVFGNVTQIDRAVVNLCLNARDALTNSRGSVRLEVRRVHIDGGRMSGMRGCMSMSPADAPLIVEAAGPKRTKMLVGLLTYAPAEYLRIRVADDGCGMSEAVMRQMFEPFFTTKNIGEGTGLGLSSVLGIVSAHGGAIAVDSTLGKGTNFDILVPLQPALTELTSAELPLPAPSASYAAMRVLLVDDDPQTRDALEAILEKVGCEASSCDNAREALAILHDEPDLFDLIITDYIMPEMNGMELAAELRHRGYARPIVLTSGRLQDVSAADREKRGIEVLLQKPFDLRSVGDMLRAVAQRRQGAAADSAPVRIAPMPPHDDPARTI